MDQLNQSPGTTPGKQKSQKAGLTGGDPGRERGPGAA